MLGLVRVGGSKERFELTCAQCHSTYVAVLDQSTDVSAAHGGLEECAVCGTMMNWTLVIQGNSADLSVSYILAKPV